MRTQQIEMPAIDAEAPTRQIEALASLVDLVALKKEAFQKGYQEGTEFYDKGLKFVMGLAIGGFLWFCKVLFFAVVVSIVMRAC